MKTKQLFQDNSLGLFQISKKFYKGFVRYYEITIIIRPREGENTIADPKLAINSSQFVMEAGIFRKLEKGGVIKNYEYDSRR